jgi:hypothetical protein
MNPLFIGPVLDIGKSIIDRLIPDPAKKQEAETELVKLAMSGDLQQVMGQLAINAKEAESSSVFVAGWRPFVGWICGAGLLYATIIHNLLEWLSLAKQWPTPPAVDSDLLIYILGVLLGVGTLRTVEKIKGVAAK